MANKKITDFSALGAAAAADDLLLLVDVSDTTEAPTGTTKKVRADQIATSGGAFEVIARTVVGVGGAASIDFTSIPGTYESIAFDFMGRGTNASATVDLYARFNGDTGANYDREVLFGGGTSAGAAQSVGAAFINMMSIPAASATAAKVGQVTGLVVGYARTVFHKVLQGSGGSWRAQTAGEGWSEHSLSAWRSTAAITQVTLLLSAGNFAEGSVAVLYGRKGA